MIRPFDWRDVGLVRRLSEQGVCLDSETCFTRGWHSLQSALLAYLAPGVGLPTCVWHGQAPGRGGAAFGQMQHRPGDDRARLLFLAPAYTATAGPAWEDLIERFVVEAGQRGAHNLVADVRDEGGEYDALRRLGFAVYVRQRIWRLARDPAPPAGRASAGRRLETRPDSGALGPGSRPASKRASEGLRPQRPADAWGIQTLYSNVVPRLVQQVEAPPRANGRGYVLEKDGEVVAHLDLARGPLGLWCEPYLHPEAYGRSAEVIDSFLRLAGGGDRPVYFCVKSYQDWLHGPLAEAGFEPAGEQAVMVKRLAVRLAEVEPSLVAVLEDARAKVTSPLVKSTRRSG